MSARCETCRDRAALAADYGRHLEARGPLVLVDPPAWLEETLAAMPEGEPEPISIPAPEPLLSLGETIRVIRMERNHNLRAFAARLHVGRYTMERIERDEVTPSPVLLARIAEALEVPAEVLLDAVGRPRAVPIPEMRPRVRPDSSRAKERAEAFAAQLVADGMDEAAAMDRARRCYQLERDVDDEDSDEPTSDAVFDPQALRAWRRRQLEAAALARPGAGGAA